MILDDEDILIGGSISFSVFEPIVHLILCGEKLSEKDIEILSSGDNNYKVEGRKDLDRIIRYFLIENNFRTISLNWIDVSNVTNMSRLFFGMKFTGDISKWNTSNVKDMSYMFSYSTFNGDISAWNISSVEDTSSMFRSSKFNREIKDWDVSNVRNMSRMFEGSKFNKDISQWNIKSLKNANYMFSNSKFNKDISNWDVSKVSEMYGMFYNSKLNTKYIKNWNIDKFLLQIQSFQKDDMLIYDMGNSYYVSSYNDNDDNTYIEYNREEYGTNRIRKFNKNSYHSKVPTIYLANSDILRYVLEVDIENTSNKEILHQSAIIDTINNDSSYSNKCTRIVFNFIIEQLSKNNPTLAQNVTLETIRNTYSTF